MLDRLRNHISKEPEIKIETMAERWKNSLIVSKYREKIYLAAISPKDNTGQTLFCELVTDRGRAARIDIPLIDNLSRHELAMQTYKKVNVLGKVDEDSLLKFTTEEFKARSFLTFLNRNSAGLDIDEVKLDIKMSDWLSNKFGLDHLIKSGNVYVGSYGSQYDHVVTIASSRELYDVIGNTQLAAEKFSRTVEKSFPHLNLYPLSIKDYLETIRAELKFMPQDWK